MSPFEASAQDWEAYGVPEGLSERYEVVGAARLTIPFGGGARMERPDHKARLEFGIATRWDHDGVSLPDAGHDVGVVAVTFLISSLIIVDEFGDLADPD